MQQINEKCWDYWQSQCDMDDNLLTSQSPIAGYNLISWNISITPFDLFLVTIFNFHFEQIVFKSI